MIFTGEFELDAVLVELPPPQAANDNVKAVAIPTTVDFFIILLKLTICLSPFL
jgi:hypothetical protein